MCHGNFREISRKFPFSVKFHGVFRENFTEISVARDFSKLTLFSSILTCRRLCPQVTAPVCFVWAEMGRQGALSKIHLCIFVTMHLSDFLFN